VILRPVTLIPILIAGLQIPLEAFACGLTELMAFEEKAQSLNSEASQAGLKLLDCPSERREAFQWLHFVNSFQQNMEPIKWPTAASKLGSQSSKIPEKNQPDLVLTQEIDAAYAGDTKLIRARLDGGDPLLSSNPEVILAVARALVRKGQFSESRQFYRSVQRLGVTESRIDLELLYTYIWERNFAAAERELNRVGLERGSRQFSDGVKRARTLIGELKGKLPVSEERSSLNPERKVIFALDAGSYVISQELRRYTGNIRFSGFLDADFSHHIVMPMVYEEKTFQRDVLWIGKENWTKGRFSSGGQIGFRSKVGKDRFLFRGSVGYRITENVHTQLEVNRRNLFEFVPLPSRAIDSVQDTAQLSFGFSPYFKARSGVARDSGGEAFSKYGVEMHPQLDFLPKSAGAVTGICRIDYEARPQPSPDYETYRQGVRLEVGAGLERRLVGDWDVAGNLRYLNLQRQGYGQTGWVQNSGAGGTLEARQQIDDYWRIAARISYNGEETLRPTQPFQNRLDLQIGAEILQ
jgi:hypothetical protein